jgi:MFS family permease
MPAVQKSSALSPFYGWYIVGASFLILFFNAGARFSIGVIFKPLISEFGWTRSQVSLAFLVNMTVFALSLVVVGRVYDRYGPKWVIVISTIFLSTGYLAVSFISTFSQFLFFYGVLVAVGLGGTSSPLVAALTSKWFVVRRGLAISVALSGSCMGQFLLIPLITTFVLSYGWRVSYFSIGLIMLVVNIGLALGIIRGDPEDLGRKPFGSEKGDEDEMPQNQVPAKMQIRDLDLRGAMGSSSFWLFTFVMFVCGSGDFLVITHLIPFVTDHGVSPATAGHMLAWYGLFSLAGLLIVGPATDVIGNKAPVVFTFVLRFFLFMMILKYQNMVSFYIFSMFFGFTFLITAPIATTLSGKLFGFTHVGVLTGFISTIHHLGGGIWAYVGGWSFDHTGDYGLAFALSSAMALAAFLCSLFIREKSQRVTS